MADIRPAGRGDYDLRGRIAVVTGGSGGIGAATVQRLARAGATVIVGYNSGRDRAEEIVASLGRGEHMALRIPVEDSAAIVAAAATVKETFGKIDVLVNSAGVTRAVPHADLEALDDATFDRILITNVRGPFATVRAFAPLLRASGDGIVINISSISGSTGLGSSIAYCASKAALDTMGLSLARVLAPEVRVISIAPAAVATEFVPGRGREGVEKQAASTPLKLVAEPDDVAMAVMAAVTHLRLTTGSTIVVDSGRHL
ncbi:MULTISPECIES: SDR family oxidoreductase [unclassified Beijerinckia]|uniref:SDR family NAD(P)-dependent oxidoreductase n=1 Tax=unclassified Beijerinckia TaxID=2638183 RepID=UPI000896C661|nr:MULTISPECIES: SDR family oxidoreductase [unclassified Beijerinckia]MDH7795832.1 3-oxoacyl-[acyl-carrier protein] reductase [Beijerinckia sp. GAS462]SEC18298.1 3-oxoacyl-[acyl-carrier protein] reductase [Beijerinckia sp. 28-YEA-48]